GWADPLDTAVGPTVAAVSAATVGAVLAARRPRHPGGWLLLAFALFLAANGVAGGYAPYGLQARPGALPAAAWVAMYYPATALAAFAFLGLVLLLVPSRPAPRPPPPPPGWRCTPRRPPWRRSPAWVWSCSWCPPGRRRHPAGAGGHGSP